MKFPDVDVNRSSTQISIPIVEFVNNLTRSLFELRIHRCSSFNICATLGTLNPRALAKICEYFRCYIYLGFLESLIISISIISLFRYGNSAHWRDPFDLQFSIEILGVQNPALPTENKPRETQTMQKLSRRSDITIILQRLTLSSVTA